MLTEVAGAADIGVIVGSLSYVGEFRYSDFIWWSLNDFGFDCCLDVEKGWYSCATVDVFVEVPEQRAAVFFVVETGVESCWLRFSVR